MLPNANKVDPVSLFGERVLVLVPHMDDAALGCGGALALLAGKCDVQLLYCTDGRGTLNKDEIREIEGRDDDIGLIRKRETHAALGILGYSPEQLTFLPHREWHLARGEQELKREIRSRLEDFAPTAVLAPSRFDKPEAIDRLPFSSTSYTITGSCCHQETSALTSGRRECGWLRSAPSRM